MRKSAFIAIGAAVAVMAAGGPAFAHPGEHAFSFGDTLAHMLGSADHLLMIAVAIAAGVGLAYAVRSSKRSS